MSIKIIRIITLLLLFPLLVEAQDSDINYWTTVDIKKDLNKWELAGELELRGIGFFEKTQRASLQVEADYEIFKGVTLGASYMVMRFYDAKYDDYQTRNRYSLLITGKKKFGRISINLREKVELTTKDESDRIKENDEIDTYRINPELLWRNRLRISYNIPGIPMEPTVGAETFYQLNNPEGNELEKVRYTISLEYKLSKQHQFELFSHLNQEFLDDETDSYVIGLGYTYNL
jgi:hypothetical protein